ncbi:MAG: hypothetical protein IJ366_07665 [Clostridia bacterium]|nr:hypothetical protein [Clostridia bacterium]
MKIEFELFAKAIVESISCILNTMDDKAEEKVDVSKIAESIAVRALDDIKNVICNEELNDFEKVDEIVEILYKNNIDTGSCHDF